MTHDLDALSEQTLILATTCDRKRVTEVCLEQLVATKRKAHIQIWDDYSTEYDLDFLRQYSPDVRHSNDSGKRIGIEVLRGRLTEEALKTPFKYHYHVDNDAFHDPDYWQRLAEMLALGKYPSLSLFNHKAQDHWTMEWRHAEGIKWQGTTPGLSFFYEAERLRKFEPAKHFYGFMGTWDWHFSHLLGGTAASIVSYVEHYGGGGLHTKSFDEHCAVNPTPYLQSTRDEVLKKITR